MYGATVVSRDALVICVDSSCDLRFCKWLSVYELHLASYEPHSIVTWWQRRDRSANSVTKQHSIYYSSVPSRR